MKKSLLALVAFAFIGALAFAEDAKTAAPALTFNGVLKTGVQVTDTIGEKATTRLFSDDIGWYPYRLDIVGSFAADQNAGFKFKLRENGNTSYSSVDTSSLANDTDSVTKENVTTSGNSYYIPQVRFAFAYANLLNNAIYLAGGYVDDSSFTTSGDDGYNLTIDQYFLDRPGFELVIKPLTGLALGFFYVTDPKGADFNLGSSYGISYTLDKVFGAEGGVSFIDSKLDSWYAGAQLLSISGLTFNVETKTNYNSSLTWSEAKDYWVREVNEVLAYNIDKLNIGLTTYEYFFGSDEKFANSNTQDNFRINPWISYDFDKTYTGKLDLYYYNGAGDIAQNGLYYADYYTGVNADYAVFKVKPSLIINVNSNAVVKVADAVIWNAGDKSAFLNQYGNDASSSGVSNTFLVDFIYNF